MTSLDLLWHLANCCLLVSILLILYVLGTVLWHLLRPPRRHITYVETGWSTLSEHPRRRSRDAASVEVGAPEDSSENL